MSDETPAISDAVVGSSLFLESQQRKAPVYDIGCGDGNISARIVEKSTAAEFHMVDPCKSWLNHARKLLYGRSNISFYEEGFGSVEVQPGAIALAMHVVYLLDGESLDRLLSLPASGVDLLVILDSPFSIFSRLWTVAAPQYLERSEYVHKRIKELDARVKKSSFATQVINPFRKDMDTMVRDSIVSTMCYANYRVMSDTTRRQVLDILKKSTNGADCVPCDSTMYEVWRSET